MSKFTPGKWIYYPPSENDVREGLTDCNIFSVQGRIGHFIGTISTEEYARLVAAAPEMYEALETLLDELPIIAGDSRHDALALAIYEAQKLLARIDGDSNVEKKEPEP